MRREEIDDKYDLAQMIVKPLYFGMGVNVLAPVLLLLVCYYLNQHYYVANRVGSMANALFYIFGALAIAEAGLAIWWRSVTMKKPMIRRTETFEQDIMFGLLIRSKPVFFLIASISIYGYLYFFLTGRFRESVFFVVFSFVVFQVVRPRYGYVRELIKHQERLVADGKLFSRLS